MPSPVVDFGSNKQEQIVHAAEVIGGSIHRQKVFKAIYSGKQKIKSVVSLMKATGLGRIAVLHAGKAFDSNGMVHQTKVSHGTAYEKLSHYQPYRDVILRAAKSKSKRDSIPTKRSPKVGGASVNLTVKLQKADRNRAIHFTIDDSPSFKKVKKVKGSLPYVKMPEKAFKDGVAAILGERGSFNDWGGELRDLSSTRLYVERRRRVAAFAFKGPGKTGRLTPGKMGKHGDQIQRLAKCAAEVFVVQYWGELDDAVFEQLEKFIQLKAYWESRKLWYGVVDGSDSARLIKAYPEAFLKRGSRKRR